MPHPHAKRSPNILLTITEQERSTDRQPRENGLLCKAAIAELIPCLPSVMLGSTKALVSFWERLISCLPIAARKKGDLLSINAQYNRAAPDSLSVKIAGYQRRRMFKTFLAATGIQPKDTVLDLGVTSDRSYSHSNYFDAWYPYKDRITACGVDDASFLEDIYPGLRFVRADGRDLPFNNATFDYVHSSAVLEHVGSRAQQRAFLEQAWRVARKGIFITTPNRWFPIEFHTMLPLAHWLPPHMFRGLCSKIGLGFFASEDHLNLMSASELKGLALQAGIEQIEVTSATLGGWPSNLLLIAHRMPHAS